MKLKEYNKKYKHMFPEFRDIIAHLREENPHFAKIFEEHDSLDKEISQLEQNPIHLINDNIELLKRKKLRLKDEIYQLLKDKQQQLE
ncbi:MULTISPECIES: YdcH family protein [unclassified Acinetobacter]|uniref:YdcH family protein n=1 Tax=unclassified Acinetobacter TaxID=196816 RepID=UPI00293454C0|nr:MULTISPECIES: DUF465 domain-containing protein [unclassified Acinetobacter]WOE31187.1 DUF465 domain-containing protein [Acinetobacter sp. SAAs470]WOE39383.1 DUF465 domain-containing protein [Acinetobacter sp. SAAs474]